MFRTTKTRRLQKDLCSPACAAKADGGNSDAETVSVEHPDCAEDDLDSATNGSVNSDLTEGPKPTPSPTCETEEGNNQASEVVNQVAEHPQLVDSDTRDGASNTETENVSEKSESATGTSQW